MFHSIIAHLWQPSRRGKSGAAGKPRPRPKPLKVSAHGGINVTTRSAEYWPVRRSRCSASSAGLSEAYPPHAAHAVFARAGDPRGRANSRFTSFSSQLSNVFSKQWKDSPSEMQIMQEQLVCAVLPAMRFAFCRLNNPAVFLLFFSACCYSTGCMQHYQADAASSRSATASSRHPELPAALSAVAACY